MFFRGRAKRREGRVRDLPGGAVRRRYNRAPALPLHLPQGVRNTSPVYNGTTVTWVIMNHQVPVLVPYWIFDLFLVTFYVLNDSKSYIYWFEPTNTNKQFLLVVSTHLVEAMISVSPHDKSSYKSSLTQLLFCPDTDYLSYFVVIFIYKSPSTPYIYILTALVPYRLFPQSLCTSGTLQSTRPPYKGQTKHR